jgi:hypothetical protein
LQYLPRVRLDEESILFARQWGSAWDAEVRT